MYNSMDLASEQQKRMFFALANQLNLDPEETKNRAKKFYGLDTFTKITKQQLTPLIDKLLAKVEETEEKERPAIVEEPKMVY